VTGVDNPKSGFTMATFFGLSMLWYCLRVQTLGRKMTGEKFIINSSTDADIVYSKATVKLVPITSAFPPPNTDVEDVDPESDLLFGTPINLGNYTGSIGNFVIPHTASSGYYLLYVYFYYHTYNLTAAYNTVVQLKGSADTKS